MDNLLERVELHLERLDPESRQGTLQLLKHLTPGAKYAASYLPAAMQYCVPNPRMPQDPLNECITVVPGKDGQPDAVQLAPGVHTTLIRLTRNGEKVRAALGLAPPPLPPLTLFSKRELAERAEKRNNHAAVFSDPAFDEQPEVNMDDIFGQFSEG